MAKISAYVSDFTIRWGAAATNGKLLPIKATSKAPKFKLCTPTGDPVKQQYVDDNNTVWPYKELHRAVETEDGLKYVGKEALEETKKSQLPVNVLNLTVHRAEDVDRYIVPSDNNAYIFVPNPNDPVNIQWHDFINVVLRESGAAFIGICNLRNNEGLFRLSMYQGHIVIQKQLYPEDLNQYDEIHPELDAATRTKALAVVAKKIEDFNPEDYRNTLTERLEELAESEHTPGEAIAAPEPQTIDLLSALDDFDI